MIFQVRDLLITSLAIGSKLSCDCTRCSSDTKTVGSCTSECGIGDDIYVFTDPSYVEQASVLLRQSQELLAVAEAKEEIPGPNAEDIASLEKELHAALEAVQALRESLG